MKIIVPYKPEFLHPDTERAVQDYDVHSLFSWMHDDVAYATLIRRLIEDRKATILVEHDIVPTRKQLDELTNCKHPWCAFAYPPFENRVYCLQSSDLPPHVVGMGLCKLDKLLLVAMNVIPFPLVRWDHVDFTFTAIARQLGFRVHQHRGDVVHHLTRHGGHYP